MGTEIIQGNLYILKFSTKCRSYLCVPFCFIDWYYLYKYIQSVSWGPKSIYLVLGTAKFQYYKVLHYNWRAKNASPWKKSFQQNVGLIYVSLLKFQYEIQLLNTTNVSAEVPNWFILPLYLSNWCFYMSSILPERQKTRPWSPFWGFVTNLGSQKIF